MLDNSPKMSLSARSMSPTDVSPFMSPISSPDQSRRESPTESPNVSPSNSPMMLKRANSYRYKPKKNGSHKSIVDDLIRKKREFRRLRSKSTPEILQDFDINCRGTRSARSSISDGSMSEEKEIGSCEENISKSNNFLRQPAEVKQKKSPNTSRRKSFQAFLGAKINHLLDDHSSKLSRSNSQRVSNKDKEKLTCRKSYHSEDENYDGPLFLATTLFVPGYDFKTKQSTPLTERKQSTPIFGRRGSKDRLSIPAAFIRNSKERKSTGSTPNLFRRGSKENVKKKDLLNNQKKFHRSDSTPVDSRLDVSNNINKDFLDHANIAERQAILKIKYKQFEDKGKYSEISLDVPQVNLKGKVKKISGTFESGTAFIKKTKEIFIDDEQPVIPSDVIDEDAFRKRAEGFEKGTVYVTKNDLQKIDASKNSNVENGDKFLVNDQFDNSNSSSFGGESGYASPTEALENNNNYNKHDIITPGNLLKNLYLDKERTSSMHSITGCDTLPEKNWSNSCSDGQWKNEKRKFQIKKRPDISRVIATDFCVTEL